MVSLYLWYGVAPSCKHGGFFMISKYKNRRTVTLWNDTNIYLNEICEINGMSLSDLIEEMASGLRKGSIMLTFDASSGRPYFAFPDDDC